MRYSIVIPACNEQARLRETVADHAAFADRVLGADGAEIIVVVNGSRDHTGAIARELAQGLPLLRVEETTRRLGKGGAVLRGFALSRAAIVSFVDADNSTTPEQLHKLHQAVDQGAVVAIGSRWLPQSRREIPQPWSRQLAGRMFNRLVRQLFDLPFADTQCGAKAFQREAFETIRPSLELTGWAFDVEILVRMRQAGFSIEEVPIRWRDSSRSRLRMHRDAPAVLWELARLRKLVAKRG
jgi:glycosyltransferase involved in cell wall biosynthesis